MELTGKKEWKWRDEKKDAFSKLKNKMMNPPILAIPDSKMSGTWGAGAE